ncbi:receptor-type tyrosine-protein phosphatase alpha [Turdus rufiventris]|nr:receptor-type tyrosine-protein phosphatase alpha [Turdus rufiventris]
MARSRAVSKPSLGSEHSRGVGPSLEGPVATCWSGLGSSGLRLGQHDDVSHLWASGSVNMDLWFFLLLLGSGLISVGANNNTAEPSTTVPTSPGSSTKAPTAGPQDGTTPNTNRLNVSTPGTVPTTASKPPPTTATRISPGSTTGSLNISSTLGTTVPVPPAPSLLPSVTPSPPRSTVPSTEAETTERNFSMVVTTQETSSASHNGNSGGRDETPIIAVMVALSSLLVIVFIIIVLYMLRFKKYKQAGSHSNSFRLSNGRTDDTDDHSRVHLTPVEGVPDSDYINASFINGYQEKNKFIAAQGPKEETVNDFWRMIWEQNTATIVMVTNLKERKECKCAQYWPDQGCWTYGNIRVSVEDVTVLVDYTVRKFCIQQVPGLTCPIPSPSPIPPHPIPPLSTLGIPKVGDVTNKKPQRLVTQFHFTSWPDFGVPFTPIGMLKFLKKMQYVFIYQALLEHYLYGDTELEVTSLEIHLQKIYNKVPGTSSNGLEEEFKKLTSIKIQNDKMRTGNLPANMKKNRVLQIIPYEFNRVIIPVKRGEENTDYVNASFIDGYRQKDSYIASQGPLQHTIEDFWRMIWEWKSCSIVMLTELEERGQEKCAQYWPSDGSVSYGDITVELKKEEECESYTVRDLLVTNTRENKSRQIRQFHFHGWPEVGIPGDGKGMINIIAAVQKQQQQSGNHPITVHCSAGAGRTGTFCALSTVLERVKAEAILDVFQTVKSLRLQRPHMVQTLEQYEFCYKVVQEYIDAFSDYANFK